LLLQILKIPTLQERIEIVLLMAKFNSPNQVICELKKKKWRLLHTSPEINVWMGISIDRVYGSYFFEGSLTKLIKIIQFSFV